MMRTENGHLKARLVKITPEQAGKWLERNPADNRNLRKYKVDSYARDMLAGAWRRNNDAIVFDKKGVLLNGQHRLNACVVSGKPFEAWVIVGEDTKARETMDMGLARTLGDVLGWEGFPSSAHFSGTVNSMMMGRTGSKILSKDLNSKWPTKTEALIFARKYKEGLEFAYEKLNTNTKIPGVTSSIMRAIVARAYYNVDVSKLERFTTIMKTGESKGGGGESTAIRLRDALISMPMTRKEAYRKIERGLEAFLANQALQIIKAPPSAGELFPLPGEFDE